MKISSFLLLFIFATSIAYSQSSQKDSLKMSVSAPDLSTWPQASQMAAKEMMKKYGPPDVVGKEMIGWSDAGPWKMIHVSKAETKHNFPIEHTDMLEQQVMYKVPADKFDELAEFDGSVVVDRTQGLMGARCDMEANNLLALNLAHDIITGKKTVADARKAYGDIIKEKMNGGNPEYMTKLTFQPVETAADPDKNTTGLTKQDVKKATKG